MVHYFLLAENLEKKKRILNDLTNETNVFSKQLNENEKELKSIEEIRRIQLKELKITEEKMENTQLKMNNCILVLSRLKTQMEDVKNVVENTTIIDVIVVDDERNGEFANGLVDLKGMF